MNRKCCFIMLLLIAAAPVCARAQANVSFAWDPFPAGGQPSGIEMSIAPVAPNTKTAIVFDCGPAPTNTCTVTAIPTGGWSATARAYNLGTPAGKNPKIKYRILTVRDEHPPRTPDGNSFDDNH